MDLLFIGNLLRNTYRVFNMGGAIMPCNNNCNQGRNCDCKKDSSVDRATVVVATLLLIFTVSMVYGLYKIIIEPVSKGQECEVTLQFKDNVKATYIGKTV